MKFKQYLTENTEYELPHNNGKSKLTTKIHPKDRNFKNLPRDSKNKPKVRFQDWLEIDSKKRNPDSQTTSYGKAANGKWYGWSHRAVYGFGIGDEIKPGTIGNKHRVGLNWDAPEPKFEPYTIKTDKEAMEHAIRFAKEVS